VIDPRTKGNRWRTRHSQPLPLPGLVWNPELTLLVKEIVPRATWTLSGSVGTVRLFTLND